MSYLDLVGLIVSAGVPVVGAIVWLVRLEGRINANKAANAETNKDLEKHIASTEAKLTALEAQTAADTKAHEETKIALVRVQEQLKHLTDLFERHLLGGPKPRRPAEL